MKSFRKELWFNIPTRRAFINITSQVEECLRESEIQEGLVLVNAMHITASVFINDDESGLHHDYEVWLEKLAPHEPVSQYRHNVGEDNADAHMKRQVMGREVVVAVTRGKLDFGTWEQIFYGEFDGRRKKRVIGEDYRGVRFMTDLFAWSITILLGALFVLGAGSNFYLLFFAGRKAKEGEHRPLHHSPDIRDPRNGGVPHESVGCN